MLIHIQRLLDKHQQVTKTNQKVSNLEEHRMIITI